MRKQVFLFISCYYGNTAHSLLFALVKHDILNKASSRGHFTADSIVYIRRSWKKYLNTFRSSCTNWPVLCADSLYSFQLNRENGYKKIYIKFESPCIFLIYLYVYVPNAAETKVAKSRLFRSLDFQLPFILIFYRISTQPIFTNRI